MIEPIHLIMSSLSGTALGAFLSWEISKNLSKNQVFREESKLLISAFSEDLAILSSPIQKNNSKVFDLLNSSFLKHHMAIIRFRFFLSDDELYRFDNAWLLFHKHSSPNIDEWDIEDNGEISHLTEYLTTSNKDEEVRVKKLAISRIIKLLSFVNVNQT